MKILEEFKSFAMRGNVIDLAVWVVIGWAFWKIVSSLVADIITPTVWVLAWWINFTTLWYTISSINWQNVTITYGNFLQSLFDFLVIAFSVFIFVKILNKAQERLIKKQEKQEKNEEVKISDEVLLLQEIRDLLKGESKSKKEVKEKVAEIKTEIKQEDEINTLEKSEENTKNTKKLPKTTTKKIWTDKAKKTTLKPKAKKWQ